MAKVDTTAEGFNEAPPRISEGRRFLLVLLPRKLVVFGLVVLFIMLV